MILKPANISIGHFQKKAKKKNYKRREYHSPFDTYKEGVLRGQDFPTWGFRKAVGGVRVVLGVEHDRRFVIPGRAPSQGDCFQFGVWAWKCGGGKAPEVHGITMGSFRMHLLVQEIGSLNGAINAEVFRHRPAKQRKHLMHLQPLTKQHPAQPADLWDIFSPWGASFYSTLVTRVFHPFWRSGFEAGS